jgi:hypothetical protein
MAWHMGCSCPLGRIRAKWGRIFTFDFQRIDDLSEPYLCSAVGLAQESDTQERRWLLALELHSYFIRNLLKKPFLQLVDQTFIEKLFYGSVCYRAI